MLNLPIDFFERTQVGRITHKINEMWKIRKFLMGQLFGTVLDCTTLIFFIPVMFFFSPVMTLVVLAICGTDRAVANRDVADLSAQIRCSRSVRKPSAGHFLCRIFTAFAPSSRWRSMQDSDICGTCMSPASQNCGLRRA